MGIRTRLITLIVALVVLAFGLSFWRFSDLHHQVMTENLAQQTQRDAAAVRQIVSIKNQSLRSSLVDLVGREQGARSPILSASAESQMNQVLAASPFLAISILKLEDQSRWRAAWIRQQTALSGRWPEAFLSGVLADIPVESARGGQSAWIRIADPAGQPVFLLLTEVNLEKESAIAVGVLLSTAMSEVSEAFLGSPTEIAVIDDRGFSVANSETAYIGVSLEESHPFVAETLKRREVSAQFRSKNRAQKSVEAAAFRVEGANLYAIAVSAQQPTIAILPRLALALVIFSIALILFGVGFGYWNIQPLEKAVDYLSAQLTAIAQGQPVGYFPQGNAYLDPLKESVDQLILREESGQAVVQPKAEDAQRAYSEISVGIAQALKDPLAAVLAQAQLARAKSGSDDLKEHFVVIERETRRARDTVENLLRLKGDERQSSSKIELQDVVLAALTAQKGLLSSHDVKVIPELSNSAVIQANASQLQVALEEVIKNAVEAMAQTNNRTLKLTTEFKDNAVVLKVEDSGIGVVADHLGKVFDPFFTTKGSENHKGLGLTVTKGIVKSAGGRLRLESVPGKPGSIVIFEFPVQGPRTGKVQMERNHSAGDDRGDIKKPITGTQADELPAAPGLDELTLSAIQIEVPPAPDGSEFKVSEDEPHIRAPKVKEPGT